MANSPTDDYMKPGGFYGSVFDFDLYREELMADPLAWLLTLYPNPGFRDNGELVLGSVAGDPPGENPAFFINPRGSFDTLGWHADEGRNYSPIQMVMAVFRIPEHEAIDKLAELAGWPGLGTYHSVPPNIGLVKAQIEELRKPPQVPAPDMLKARPKGIVETINEQYALVIVGGKSTIIRESCDEQGRPLTEFMTKEAFHDWFSNKWVQLPDGGSKPASKLWFNDSRRRQYAGVVFSPQGCSPAYYNLWRGFAVEPKPGKCDLFLSHIHENVCQGNDALYTWFVAWLAQIVQEPHVKPGSAVVLRGRHGTGKSIVGDVMRSLLFPHDTKISKAHHLTGQFNAHLKQTILLQVEEGFWAGDKQAEGSLKDLITSDEQMLEMKTKDAFPIRNLVRVLITSNHDWVVPTAFDERRFAIFDVGDKHRKDFPYFEAIMAQMDNGGREALLNHLLTLDISGVNLREVPQTAGLVDQKLQSLAPEQRWWLDCLTRGYIVDSAKGWPGWVETERAYKSYVDRADQMGARFRESSAGFVKAWRKMAELKPSKRGPQDNRNPGYDVPSLEACRKFFEEKVGGAVEWPE